MQVGDNLRDIMPLTSPSLLPQACHCEDLRCHRECAGFSSLYKMCKRQFMTIYKKKDDLAHGFIPH